MFESNKFMTLNKKKNVILVGPSSDVVTLLGIKYHYMKFLVQLFLWQNII